MPEFHDFFISKEIKEEAQETGWSSRGIEISTKVLEAKDGGELKRKIKDCREEHVLLAFRGGEHDLTRKAFSDSRMDIVLSPEKGRKDSPMNHIDAEKAAENSVAVGLSLKQIPKNSKRQSQILSKWRKNLKLCKKYKTPYIITTEAEEKHELRKPRDMAAIPTSLGYNGIKAVKNFPRKILEKNLEVQKDSQVRPGHEVLEE